MYIHKYIHIHTQPWMIYTFFVHIIIQTKIVVIPKKNIRIYVQHTDVEVVRTKSR